jgi:hypothetical protein
MNTPRCSHHETSLFGHVLRHVLTMRFLQDALLQGFLTLERVKGTPSAGKRVNRTAALFSFESTPLKKGLFESG